MVSTCGPPNPLPLIQHGSEFRSYAEAGVWPERIRSLPVLIERNEVDACQGQYQTSLFVVFQICVENDWQGVVSVMMDLLNDAGIEYVQTVEVR